MKRRDFLARAGAATISATFPRWGLAQQTGKVPRIVVLAACLPSETAAAFRNGLQDFGWIDGTNLNLQMVSGATYTELISLVPAAVATNPDLILAWGIAAATYAIQETRTIPIVLGGSAGDPVNSNIFNWTQSAKDAGNVTGITLVAPDLLDKQMKMIKQMIPPAKRVGILNVPEIAATPANIDPIAQAMGLDLVMINLAGNSDLASQFVRVVAAAADVIYVPMNPYFAMYRDDLYDLLVKNSLRALDSSSETGLATPFTGVVSYGTNPNVLVRRSAYFADAILRGAKPSDLLIEYLQPTVFDVAVNLWAAHQIGFSVPASVMAQATQVIDYDIRGHRSVP